jgi:hypothetical protein
MRSELAIPRWKAFPLRGWIAIQSSLNIKKNNFTSSSIKIEKPTNLECSEVYFSGKLRN